MPQDRHSEESSTLNARIAQNHLSMFVGSFLSQNTSGDPQYGHSMESGWAMGVPQHLITSGLSTVNLGVFILMFFKVKVILLRPF